MIIPFSQVGSAPPPAEDPYADAADGASVAGDGSAFLASDNATAALRPAYNFHDLATLDPSSEIGALAGVDDGAATFNLASFSFPYFSNAPTGPHTAVKIGSNGYIFFGSNPASWVPSNWTPGGGAVNTLPQANDPNYLIAPLMKDYEAAHVYAKEITTSGQKRLIVQWEVQDIYGALPTDIFQCVLREDGSIYFYYDTLRSDVSGAQSTGSGTGVGYDVSPFIYGCQNGDHTSGVFIGGSNPVANGALVGQALSEGLAIRIKPPV